MTTKTNTPKTPKNPNRHLKPGMRVVNIEDGEPGRIVRVCSYRRNGEDAYSYLVETAYGREVWEVGELSVLETPND